MRQGPVCDNHCHARGLGGCRVTHNTQRDRRPLSTLTSISCDLRWSCKGFAPAHIIRVQEPPSFLTS